MKNILFFGAGFLAARLLVKPQTNVNGLRGLNGFFDDVRDLVELRRRYFELVKNYHPDRNQDKNEKELKRLTELMQEINGEYEKLAKKLPKERGVDFENEEDRENEFNISEIYKDIINAVQSYDLIKIELIGSWVWVSGNTYPIRKELKAAGFLFAPVKKMWYWRPGDQKFYPGYESENIDKIRNKYGSSVIDRDAPKALSGLDMNLLNILNALQLLIAK